ncbi:Rap1a/Tai family immunity protein [Pseudomonas sp.]|uniref:Rap1a/Tai family immunity protein n=1 Tax=Pseudomonas sp. TaxID=306 RepID=UPI0026193055|nr:Rap1a/Tai family immunity protein [Pseudomonas sp.]
MKLKYVMVLLAGMVSEQATAGFLSAQELYKSIKGIDAGTPTASREFDGGQAYGYIFAVYDLYEGLAVCAPAGTSGGQVLRVVQNQLEQHPESWGLPASVEVTKALTSVWPCKRQ